MMWNVKILLVLPNIMSILSPAIFLRGCPKELPDRLVGRVRVWRVAAWWHQIAKLVKIFLATRRLLRNSNSIWFCFLQMFSSYWGLRLCQFFFASELWQPWPTRHISTPGTASHPAVAELSYVGRGFKIFGLTSTCFWKLGLFSGII